MLLLICNDMVASGYRFVNNLQFSLFMKHAMSNLIDMFRGV